MKRNVIRMGLALSGVLAATATACDPTTLQTFAGDFFRQALAAFLL